MPPMLDGLSVDPPGFFSALDGQPCNPLVIGNKQIELLVVLLRFSLKLVNLPKGIFEFQP